MKTTTIMVLAIILSSLSTAWLTVKWEHDNAVSPVSTSTPNPEVQQNLVELRSQIRALEQRLEQISTAAYPAGSDGSQPESSTGGAHAIEPNPESYLRGMEPATLDIKSTNLEPAPAPQYSSTRQKRLPSQPPALPDQQPNPPPSQMLVIDPTPEQTETYERLNARLDNPDYLAGLNIKHFAIQPEFRTLPRAMQMLLFNKAMQQFNSGKIPEEVFAGRTPRKP